MVGFFAKEVYVKYFKKEKNNATHLPIQKIKNAQTPEELLRIMLALRLQYNIQPLIEELEEYVYKARRLESFEKLKQKVIKKLD